MSDRAIRVKPLCNWTDSRSLTRSLYRYGKNERGWGDLVLSDSDDSDFFTIYNMPRHGEHYEPERTIVFQMEPMRNGMPGDYGAKSWGEWANPDESKFLAVRSHRNAHNNCEWHVDRTYNDLKHTSFSTRKSELLSAVISDKRCDIGHELRISFLRYLENNAPGLVDIFGRCGSLGFDNYHGTLPEGDKSDGIIPYKYTIAVENNREHNYFTEKIIDPLVSDTLCFYWGCPNLEDYFDGAFIRLPLDTANFSACLSIIKDAIHCGHYARALPRIQAAKQKILDEYQYFPTVERIIKSLVLS